MSIGLERTMCEGKCFIFHIPNSNIIHTLFSFYLPVVIMVCFYLKIFLAFMYAASKTHSLDHWIIERKTTKTLATVMGVFLSLTFNPVTNYSVPPPLTETFVWLGRSDSMLNPFVYGFFYSCFQIYRFKYFMAILQMQSCYDLAAHRCN